MVWGNYGKWVMKTRRSSRQIDITTPEGFYTFFRHDNFKPEWVKQVGFKADPQVHSPLDRDANVV
jgi:hypothetical protein